MSNPWDDFNTAPKGGPWEDFDTRQPMSNIPQESEVGAIPAALRSFDNAALFGFGNKAASGLDALLDQLTGNNNGLSLLNDYKQRSQAEQQLMEAGQRQHPIASTIGSLAGGVLPAIATEGAFAPGITGAAQAGATFGALNAAGEYTGDSYEEQAKKALEGAGLGGIIGGGLGVAGQALKPALGALNTLKGGIADLPKVKGFTEAFSQGAEGNKLFGSDALDNVFTKAETLKQGIGDDIQSALSGLDAEKTQRLLAGENPVNIYDFAKNMSDAYDNMVQRFGARPDVLEDLNKARGILETYVNGNEDIGLPGKGFNLSPMDAENLRTDIGQLGYPNNNTLSTNEGKEFVRTLIAGPRQGAGASYGRAGLTRLAMDLPSDFKPLTQTLNEALPQVMDQSGNIIQRGLGDINSDYHDMLNASTANQGIDTRAILKNRLGNDVGVQLDHKLNEFLDMLPPDLNAKWAPQIQDIGNQFMVAKKIATGGIGMSGLLAAGPKGEPYALANLGGLMWNSTPEAIKGVAQRVATLPTQGAQQLGSILSQAADKDRIGRNALIFAIQQNPTYREILRQANGEPSGSSK